MEPIYFFNSTEHLEPKCPGCDHKIEYGVTTSWSDKTNAQECNGCHTVLK